ncbi:hypothetical protein A2617_01645 [Candidatus Daviesbacteria bacterium RIFOXYD1_FULL_41_10]|uniref:Type II toxin-antitoxin system mRNA interferase toxin, RelE/StbE family n=2 Tax=Candidatus Daviesiibacteriota TaxID=1752718 RepID=A0A1F5MZE1_9BACT|nr:MAG: hypothetical protein UU67_C0032G0007 [Candidatus Daviesbacteria bacterium GW2011_GWB1_41_5]OGE70769.1 MAG: hypothetical protein A2617_01645 [Candidatus Daviesbacteria bacterium RIFOXYD1_FULL_41_10]
MQIFYSSYFAKQIKKLTPEEKSLLSKFEKKFRQNPFSPDLKTHKLSGKLKNYWACSINYKIMVIFELQMNNKIILVNIGGHNIYR